MSHPAKIEDETHEALTNLVEQGLRDRDESIARGEEAHTFTSVDSFMAWLDEGDE